MRIVAVIGHRCCSYWYFFYRHLFYYRGDPGMLQQSSSFISDYGVAKCSELCERTYDEFLLVFLEVGVIDIE
jgi:hypothetical protein